MSTNEYIRAPTHISSETRIELPPIGTLWSRMSKPQRRVAIATAMREGRTMPSLGSDYGVRSEYDQRILRREWKSMTDMLERELEQTRRTSLPPPGPGVTIDHLNSYVCRWPLWSTRLPAPPTTEEAFYCGAPTIEGSPYCQVCHDRGTRVPRMYAAKNRRV